MHANEPHPSEPLTDLERQLQTWRPDDAGLSPDAMLFAAGRASARRPRGARFAWPAIAAGLAVVASGFAVWAALQQSQIEDLRSRLEQHPPAGVSPSIPESSPVPWHPSSYLTLRQQIPLRDGHDLVAYRPTPGANESPPASPVLRAFDLDSLLMP